MIERRPPLTAEELRKVLEETSEALKKDREDDERLAALGWSREAVTMYKALRRFPGTFLSRCGPNADWRFRLYWKRHTVGNLLRISWACLRVALLRAMSGGLDG